MVIRNTWATFAKIVVDVTVTLNVSERPDRRLNDRKENFVQVLQTLPVCVCLALIAGLAGCSQSTESVQPPPSSNRTQSGSHARMLLALEEIKNAPIFQSVFFGNRSLEKEEEDLNHLPSNRPDLRFKLLFHIGRRRLWLGDTKKAIEHLQDALQLVDNQLLDAPQSIREDAIFQLGLAYLRLGENENCVNCTNGESCLFPIHNAGIHDQQIGSRTAIIHFRKLLDLNPQHTEARWLLNIANMTVGEFPGGVPEEFRVSSHLLKSDTDFPRFRNIAPQKGLGTLSLSGGSIVDDFDGDGDLDIMVSSCGFADQLKYFRNDDGKFVDATTESNLEGLYGGLNLVQADYDNDDDIDVFVMRGAWLGDMGRMPNSLLQNDGTGIFRDVTFDCGLGSHHFPTQTAGWGDFNNDGHLDLYIGNETFASQLFQNDGQGKFRDIAATANVENRRFAKGVAIGDFNNDRFPDIYVSNLGGDNRLYENQRDGTFIDVASDLGVTEPKNSLPAWFWDYNQDGLLDIFVASYSDDLSYVSHRFFDQPATIEFDHLYQGNGENLFNEVGRERNLLNLTQAMGANFGDLDNDGYPDFYVGTGFPQYEGLVPNLMYWNRNGIRFEDITTAGRFGHLQKGHAISFADIDQDGDQDVFQQMGGAFPGDRAADCLYENPGCVNNWIKIKLIGRQSNRSAIGARITVDVLEAGKHRNIYDWVNSGGSFGANPLRQEIGLGCAKHIERLEVFWPTTNQTQIFTDLAVNQSIEIVEGSREYKKVTLTEFNL
jgi:tetratricopeptide (TPR) repeat protein